MKKIGQMIFIAALSLISCGGGGGGGTSTPATTTSGYPDVAGLYSLNVKAGTLICSDGSTGSANAFAKNVRITQNINQISIVDTSSSPLPAGMTLLSGNNLTGNVDLAGSFITNQTLVVQITGIPGNTTLLYNFTGAFTATGWSGIYIFTMANPTAFSGSCSATLTFTGELISKSNATANSLSEQAEADGTPAGDSTADLAARLLGLSVDGSGPDNLY